MTDKYEDAFMCVLFYKCSDRQPTTYLHPHLISQSDMDFFTQPVNHHWTNFIICVHIPINTEKLFLIL